MLFTCNRKFTPTNTYSWIIYSCQFYQNLETEAPVCHSFIGNYFWALPYAGLNAGGFDFKGTVVKMNWYHITSSHLLCGTNAFTYEVGLWEASCILCSTLSIPILVVNTAAAASVETQLNVPIMMEVKLLSTYKHDQHPCLCRFFTFIFLHCKFQLVSSDGRNTNFYFYWRNTLWGSFICS